MTEIEFMLIFIITTTSPGEMPNREITATQRFATVSLCEAQAKEEERKARLRKNFVQFYYDCPKVKALPKGSAI